MRRSVVLQQQLRESIDEEYARRTRIHQGRINRLKSSRAAFVRTGAALPPLPLVMLAHGDSWFDYPLDGNSISFSDTDVIAQLRTMGTLNPIILNISHYGESSTDEMSWPKQQRLIDALENPDNWLDTGKPDAIQFSGGGDDIAGDQFCVFLNDFAPGAVGLNSARFTKALGMVEASYLDLFAFRDRHAPDVPIFGHCYDFAIPNGKHPDCIGPWLKPSLDFSGWHNLSQTTPIVHQGLVQFKDLLTTLSNVPGNKFTLIDTQGTLDPAHDWANELHPFPNGFVKIASRFMAGLRAKFPGRI